MTLEFLLDIFSNNEKLDISFGFFPLKYRWYSRQIANKYDLVPLDLAKSCTATERADDILYFFMDSKFSFTTVEA